MTHPHEQLIAKSCLQLPRGQHLPNNHAMSVAPSKEYLTEGLHGLNTNLNGSKMKRLVGPPLTRSRRKYIAD